MNELGEGCFPSQQQLMEYSGLDKKTIIKHTKIAVDAGFLGVRQHGFRGQKWKRLEYVARWPERGLTGGDAAYWREQEGGGCRPPPSETEVVDAIPEGGGTQGVKVVEQVHQDKTSPGNFPKTSPSEREARKRGREDSQPEATSPEDTPGRAAFQNRVRRLCTGQGFIAGPWPYWDKGASFGWIEKQFAKLSPQERAEAERWRDAYLLNVADRKIPPSDVMGIGNFFLDRRWTTLDPTLLERVEKLREGRLPPEERARSDGWVKGMGPVGMARIFAALLDGPADAQAAAAAAGLFVPDATLRKAWPLVHQLKELQRQKGGFVLGERWHALKSAMEPVPKDTEMLARWKDAFRERGWPWLAVFDRLEVVHCPKGGPERLQEFEAAVKEQEQGYDGRGQETGGAGGADRRYSGASGR